MAIGGAVSLKALHQLPFVSCFSQNGRFQVGKHNDSKKVINVFKRAAVLCDLWNGMEWNANKVTNSLRLKVDNHLN